MSRISLHYLLEPEVDRWLPGDRWVRPIVRRIVRGPHRPGGVDKVFINLCLGLDRLGLAYDVNRPYAQLKPGDLVGVLGRGRSCLRSYHRREPLVAGIGLMTHPSEWPTLCEDYPVACYLQHSAWADAVYRPFYGARCEIWPVGIDTYRWTLAATEKAVDFLVYRKTRWDAPDAAPLADGVEAELRQRCLSYEVLRYGAYDPAEYAAALHRCRAMIYLSSHESQGIAYQEAMSSGVPILAWDPGFVLDPERFKWGQPTIPATSVPYFDERCGRRFAGLPEFPRELSAFVEALRAKRYAPRDYVLENLTLEKCAAHFVRILRERLA